MGCLTGDMKVQAGCDGGMLKSCLNSICASLGFLYVTLEVSPPGGKGALRDHQQDNDDVHHHHHHHICILPFLQVQYIAPLPPPPVSEEVLTD